MTSAAPGSQAAGWHGLRYRLEVRLADGDTGRRVVIRWRCPAGNGDEIADVLGILEAADAASFTVRKSSGQVVTIPRDRPGRQGRTPPLAPVAAVPRHELPYLPTGGLRRRQSATPPGQAGR